MTHKELLQTHVILIEVGAQPQRFVVYSIVESRAPRARAPDTHVYARVLNWILFSSLLETWTPFVYVARL